MIADVGFADVVSGWQEDALAMAHLVEHEYPDFNQLQRQALADGVALPPSSLRALLRETVAELPPPSPDPAAAASSSCASSSGFTRVDSTLADAGWSLSHLPDCVLLSIFSHLDAPTLTSVTCASTEFACLLAHADDLWRSLVDRRFEPVRWALPAGALTPGGAHETWRELYLARSTPGAPTSWRNLAVADHCTDDSCWLVLGEGVYDVTEFMHRHPGMAASLKLFGGTDATEVRAPTRGCVACLYALSHVLSLSTFELLTTPPSSADDFSALLSAQAFADVPHSPLAHHFMRTLQVPGLSLPSEAPPRLLSAEHAPTWSLLAQQGSGAAAGAAAHLSETLANVTNVIGTNVGVPTRLHDGVASGVARLRGLKAYLVPEGGLKAYLGAEGGVSWGAPWKSERWRKSWEGRSWEDWRMALPENTVEGFLDEAERAQPWAL